MEILMSKGIYGYYDLENNTVVYIGKDTRIHNDRRHKDHNTPSRYNEQKINKVIQNNPDRYDYFKLYESDDVDDETLNQLEKKFIDLFKTNRKRFSERHVFNFTDGGEDITGINNPMYNKHHTEEWKKQNSKRMKGNKHLLGHKHSDETRAKMRESRAKKVGELAPCWKNYARLLKSKSNTVKQGYRYYIKYNGKKLKSSIDFHKLCEWFFKEYPKLPLHVEVNNG